MTEKVESEKRMKEAFIWTLKAAKKNHFKALLQLGDLYERGIGTPRDLHKAKEAYQKAFEIALMRKMIKK